MSTGTVARKGALALVAMLIALLGAEAAFRGWLRAQGTPYDGAEGRAAIQAALDRVDRRVPRAGAAPADGKVENLAARKILHPFLAFETELSLSQLARDAEYFARPQAEQSYDVFVVGGSVAAGFANHGTSRLTRVLRADPRFAERNVRVFNYARGAFKQPQQVIMLCYLLGLGFAPDAVINLDGFNEVAQSNVNVKLKTHPLYPSIAQWGPLAHGGTTDRKALDFMVEVRHLQREAERWVERAERWGLYHSSFLGKLTLSRLNRLRRRSVDVQNQFLDYITAEDAGFAKRGPAFKRGLAQVMEVSVRCWEECSLSLDAICERRSILYLNVLQPTLHDEGSKPVTDEERGNGTASREWLDAIGHGYPMLREAGRRLRERGVRFFDASQAFAEVGETLYVDACHFNRRGNEILAEQIGRELLSHVPR